MTILVLSNKSGAMVDFRIDLIKKLLEENDVVISTPFDDKMDILRKLPVKLIECPVDRRGINLFKDLKLYVTYKKIIKEQNPDLIMTYTIKPNIYGGIAARVAKKQYAVNITGLGTAFENSGILRTIVVNLYKIALKKAKVVFFENSGDRDRLLFLGCCKEGKTQVLNGAGVDTDKFSYQAYPYNDKMKFLFIGRVMKEKGVDELFEAMKRLVSEGEECFLDVVGPFEEDYKAKLDQYEKAGWLKYHGYQEDVIPFITACDCFVLPSYHEGMANTNLECASSGRPIITSNIPGCKEAIVDGSGLLCEPKNIISLYTTMKKMISTSREEREQMGIAGRKHMKDVFDKEKVVNTTIKNLY